MDDSDDEDQTPSTKRQDFSKDRHMVQTESCSGNLSHASEVDNVKDISIRSPDLGISQKKIDSNEIVDTIPSNKNHDDSVNDERSQQQDLDADSEKSNDTFFEPDEEEGATDNALDAANTSASQGSDVPSTSQNTAPQRPTCKYAANCYR